jgi:hypothetical protein
MTSIPGIIIGLSQTYGMRDVNKNHNKVENNSTEPYVVEYVPHDVETASRSRLPVKIAIFFARLDRPFFLFL